MESLLPSPIVQFQRVLENEFSTAPENIQTTTYDNGNAIISLHDTSSGIMEHNQAFKISYQPQNNRVTIHSLREKDDVEQTNVLYSGQELLDRLKRAASNSNIRDLRIGEDRANLNLKDEENNTQPIDMAKLKILQHGETWYNRNGFRGPNYEQDTADNNIIRNKPLSRYVKKDIQEDFEEQFGPLSDYTVASFGAYTQELLQKGKPISAIKLAIIREIVNQKLPFVTAQQELKYFT